jgi:terminase large subunit-like protein
MEPQSHPDSLTKTMSAFPQLIVPLPDGTMHMMYEPSSAKHQQFHESDQKNLLAYGNRGGGKSVLLRFDAHMRAMSVPNVNLILVRRTYPELMRSHLIHIGAEMKMLGGDYHKTEHVAYYPNNSKLFFSHVSTEADSLNLLSAEFLAAYFDELSTIPWDFFVKLCASVRVRRDSGLIAVVRAATNPLGPSAAELYSYFVNKDVDPEDDPDYNPNDWDAIKIQMEDNPHLDQEQYKTRFSGMPAYLRKAWLDGDFALENQLFDFRPKKDGKEYHVISSLPVISNMPILSENW